MNLVAQGCGIVVMLILIFFFSMQKKLNLKTMRAFLAIWWSAFFVLVFEALIIGLINYIPWVSSIVIQIVCKFYLCAVIWETMMYLWYVCVDISYSKKIEMKFYIFIACVGIISSVLIAIAPIHVYSQGNVINSYGICNTITCVVVLVTMSIISGLLYKNKAIVHPQRRYGVISWISFAVAAVIIQFILDRLLLIGISSALGVLIKFLVIENPVSNVDRDTGLFNLNGLFQYMKEIQGKGNQVSVLCINYDNNRNGTSTFETEREISREVAEFISSTPNAYAFRSSANEFLLVFDRIEDGKAAIARTSERFSFGWGENRIRMLAVDWYFLESTEVVESAMDILPIFQYARQNRNDFASVEGVVINNSLIERIYTDRNVESIIIEALNEDRVEVFYQPIFNTKKQKFTTAEALVRIRNRDGVIIPPGNFIEIAERKGLIIRLGERVFEKTCKFIRDGKLDELGIEYIEINLSVVLCVYEYLARDFIHIMDSYQVNPNKIVLEITESASIREKNILLENMQRLRNVGVRFALDDFGTGNSNLNYIVDMPVDIVKFDRTMTNAYFDNGRGKPVMDAAMGMIQELNLEIVSEGIEEKSQYTELSDLGIDYIQGYYFSKPKEENEFVEFIRDNNEEEHGF